MIDIGAKISAARNAKRYKQCDLARRASIASAQLCKVENGRVNPSFNMVERIAEALDMTIPELLYGEKRKTALMSVAVKPQPPLKARYIPLRAVEPDAAKAQKAIKDEALRTAVECTIAFNKAHFKYEGAGASFAEELRADLGLGTAPVGDLRSALGFRGVEVYEGALSKHSGSVAFWDTVRKSPIIVLNSGATPERRLFRLVYELGSAALYASLGFRLDESLDQHRFLTDFTSAFLMPGITVCTCVAATAIDPGAWTLDAVLPLKSYFGVSAESFILRLDELGLITPKLRLALRDRLRAYYKKHPKAMEPHYSTVR